MLAMLLLYVAGSLFLLLFVAWLAVTVYLYLLHRRYAHIPSPKMPSFYLGHLTVMIKAIEEEGSVHHAFLKWSREVGPVFVYFYLYHEMLVTINPEDVKLLCTRPIVPKSQHIYGGLATVLGERFLGHGLLTIINYSDWKPRRSLYDPAFNKSFLKGLIPSFNECVDQFLERLRPLAGGRTQILMKEEFSALTLNVISKVAFSSDFMEILSEKSLGLKYSKANGMLTFLMANSLEGYQKSVIPFFKFQHPVLAKGYLETIRAIRKIGRECIQKRINMIKNGEQMPDDILTHIVKLTTTTGDVDIEDLVDDFTTFYVAGQETTSNLLSFTLILLCQHPDILERVLAEISDVLGEKEAVTTEDLEQLQYLEQVFMETLRLYPPALGVCKEAPKGLTLSNYEIPEGTSITLSSFVGGRLSEYFEDPLIFDPNRFDPGRERPNPFVYFPFGIGHRTCIGKTFAMMEAKVIMSRLLQQFRVTLPEGYELRLTSKTTLQPKDNVPCALISV